MNSPVCLRRAGGDLGPRYDISLEHIRFSSQSRQQRTTMKSVAKQPYIRVNPHVLIFRDCVCDDHRLVISRIDHLNSRFREDAMRDDGISFPRTGLKKSASEECLSTNYTCQNPRALQSNNSLTQFGAAWNMVPQVSAISSTIIATSSYTSPTDLD